MKKIHLPLVLALIASSFATSALAADRAINTAGDRGCAGLPNFTQLQTALLNSVSDGPGFANAPGPLGSATRANGGLNFPMWATVVNSTGRVCAVAKIGATDPWPGSRVISAQKAYTANAFSREGFALSTANLFSAVQPGGSLYGLQHSNPVNPLFAYAGDSANFGAANDPMVGTRVGGVNVFGGGLALYAAGRVIGAIGVSGDTSCTDHNVAWRMRQFIATQGLGISATVPSGVAAGTDNIIYDITSNPAGGVGLSASGFGHPTCINNVAPLP